MTDIVDKATRSKMMSNIRGKNTRLEVIIRKELFARGLRYRLHDKRLPGKPDMVFPKFKAVIFVNGCFWHGHDCGLYREPKSNSAFWVSKISRNRENDDRTRHVLMQSNWRVLIVWECAIRLRRYSIYDVIDMIAVWLTSAELSGEIRC